MINELRERSGVEMFPAAGIDRAMYVLTQATTRSLDKLNTKFVQIARDGQMVETGVYDHRHSADLDGENHLIVCFSSQVGCEQGCPFCVSGAPKELPNSIGKVRLVRSLSVGEIVDQVTNAVALSKLQDEEDSKILLSAMGMGEPFDNFDNVVTAAQILGNLWPQRSRLTISTICREQDLDKVDELAQRIRSNSLTLPVKMHFSLHGPDDATRRKLVPKGAPVQTVLGIANKFARSTQGRVKLNYVLMNGFNDSLEQAYKLAKVLSSHPIREVASIKLSELNPYGNYFSPARGVFEMFRSVLAEAGLTVSIFSSAVDGGQVGAGCGQLAKRTLQELHVINK